MTITKYLHSCLLIEKQNKKILIDPGIYTLQDKVLDINSLTSLEYILITHEHPDHFSIDLIKKIINKYPKANIITNESVHKLLGNVNILSSIFGNEIVSFENILHEQLWDTEVPQNLSFTLFDELTHPGDSLQFSKSSNVLALPITAPWTSVTKSVEAGLKFMPKTIIPIHDWHWKDEVRLEMYQRLEGFFSQKNIKFISLETGIPSYIE